MAKALWLWEPNANSQFQTDASLGVEPRYYEGVRGPKTAVKRNRGPHLAMYEDARNATDDGSNGCSA